MTLDFNIGDMVYTTSNEFEDVNNYNGLDFIMYKEFNNLDFDKCIINQPAVLIGIGITELGTNYRLQLQNVIVDKESDKFPPDNIIIRKHIFKTKEETINFIKTTLTKKIDKLMKELEKKKLILYKNSLKD